MSDPGAIGVGRVVCAGTGGSTTVGRQSFGIARRVVFEPIDRWRIAHLLAEPAPDLDRRIGCRRGAHPIQNTVAFHLGTQAWPGGLPRFQETFHAGVMRAQPTIDRTSIPIIDQAPLANPKRSRLVAHAGMLAQLDANDFCPLTPA